MCKIWFKNGRRSNLSVMSDLTRFVIAQKGTHADALCELRNGYKISHWSWWEIPQISGLGMSGLSRKYAIRDLAEAKEYLRNHELQEHLLELCEALLSLDTSDAEYVMGYPDNLKLRSCMTLFREADPACEVFQKVLNKYYNGKPDERTLQLLGK